MNYEMELKLRILKNYSELSGSTIVTGFLQKKRQREDRCNGKISRRELKYEKG
jgi:hypothetical protein